MVSQADEQDTLLAIGFWANRVRPDLPIPQLLVAPLESESDRARIVAYLRGGSTIEVWRGWSHCRFDCGTRDEDMGHADLSDGRWVWPEGLAHYVERHGVVLPSAFVEHARSHGFVCPPTSRARYRYADEAWITWALQRGAATKDFTLPQLSWEV